tara:strand:- start:46 stop:657 length:612 start_codon:yes stop_codon:yes gene_type:complete
MKKISEMTYAELRTACVTLELVLADQKKATMIDALEAHETTSETAAPGRPVDPTSARQVKLAEMAKRADENGGEITLGRPVDPTSARQVMLAKRAEGDGLLGRPVNPESKRQQEIAAKQAKIDGGYIPKRGRPKGTGKNQLVAKAEAEAMKTRFQVVITDEAGDESNYTKSFTTPAAAVKEMKKIGIETANYKCVEFTAEAAK